MSSMRSADTKPVTPPEEALVDLIEVCGLLAASFTLKRLDVGWLIFGNVVSIILGVIGCLQLVFSDWALSNAPSDYPRPWMDTLDLAFILMIPFPYVCPLV
ncbi:hypothetical protein IFM47457_10641 [Aspergillus lentulus]|nr:hypothetical protein IFM47457_10641 [Aspergillus lentulus]